MVVEGGGENGSTRGTGVLIGRDRHVETQGKDRCEDIWRRWMTTSQVEKHEKEASSQILACGVLWQCPSTHFRSQPFE